MKHTSLGWAWRSALAATLVAGFAISPMSTNAAGRATAASPVYLTTYSQAHTTMVRNFNPFVQAAQLDFTRGAIYEPLVIVTTAGSGHTYPWLATSWAWSNGNKTLTFTIRHNVKWSDGLPLTAADVVFTYMYGKTHPAADQTGLWASKQLVSVKQVGSDKVALTFSTVNTLVLNQAASNMWVIPQHIWSKIDKPETFDNQNPVGSGPFTNVIYFSPQEYILGKNPYYWQPGKPAFDGIKVPAYSTNTSALAALVHGDLDWDSDFVPNVQKAFVAQDPAHFHYFYATNTYTIGLYFNDSVYPYSLVPFRQAVSNAINRQQVSTIGENGNEPPADAIGLKSLWPSWADPSLNAKAQAAAAYNPDAAKATLKAAGFTWDGSGNLIDPKGKAVSFVLECPAGWSDWILSYQVMAKNLKAIGMNVTIKQVDQNSFFDQRQKGTIDGGWFAAPQSGPNPYWSFYSTISQESLVPTGQDATLKGNNNDERWASAEASQLLAQWRQTADTAAQHKAANRLQAIWLANLPVIPIMYAATWYNYSTRHVTGFPDKSNFYANGATYLYPDNVKILTTLTPTK